MCCNINQNSSLWRAAEFQNPEPLEVYTDPENPLNSIQTFIALTGFIGDLLQQAICAHSSSHSAEKGCMRCFCLTTNTLPDGTNLGAQRMLGMHHPVNAEVFQVPEDGGDADLQIREGLVLAIDQGAETVFQKNLAAELTISHQQQCIRTATAALAAEHARESHPLPPALPAAATPEEREAHRAGAVPIEPIIIPTSLQHHLGFEQCTGAERVTVYFQ
jgi:hypothetical protein